jgi:hypothetical protein
MDALVVGCTEAVHAMINRNTNSGFWTRKRDRMLQKRAAAGESPEAIATYFATTPQAILRRLYRLSGKAQRFAKDAGGFHEIMGKLPKEKRARQDVVLAEMRAEIKKGMWRDRAIYEASRLGVGSSAIADALALSRTQIWRILVLQGAPEHELKERAKKRRKERERIVRPAMDALRLAIGRGSSRDQAMAEAYKAGLTLRAIGDMYGLTRERIRQIIARR